jgi:hypothetical protein
MFGYTANELNGQPVEILIPGSFRHGHQELREGFHKKPFQSFYGGKQRSFCIKKKMERSFLLK